MDQAEREARTIELNIARRIREKRKELGLTLEELAKETGLSKGHLSQIENGGKVPPISTLSKIAFSLETSVGSLVTGERHQVSSNKIEVSRVEDRKVIHNTEASPQSVYESFGFKKQNRVMRSAIVTMSHDFPSRPIVHSGQEFVFALEGEHEFYYDEQIFKIHPGDTYYFDSNYPHMGRSLGEIPAKVLVVFCNPSELK